MADTVMLTGHEEIRDWAAFEPAVAAGYKAMIEALDRLEVPVTDLRRRSSLHELANGFRAPARL